jgi:ribonuclease VapC
MIVADTSAIFAFLAAEPEAEIVASRMYGDTVIMNAATWTETGVVVARKLGAGGMARLRRLAAELPIEIVEHDMILAEAAVAAHERYGRGSGHPADLNLGDCFSYALARTRGLPLLFKGDDFIHTDIEPALKLG